MSMDPTEFGGRIVHEYVTRYRNARERKSGAAFKHGDGHSFLWQAKKVEHAEQIVSDIRANAEDLNINLADCVATVRLLHPDAPEGCPVCGAGRSGGEGETEAQDGSDAPEDDGPPTICYGCAHFLNKEPGSVREHVWYNHFCTATPVVKMLNIVTGLVGEICQDDYEHCRYVNDGRCPKYEVLAAQRGETDGD